MFGLKKHQYTFRPIKRLKVSLIIFLPLRPFSRRGLDNPNVLPDVDKVSNPIDVEPANPLLADKLPISYNTVDAVLSEKSDKSLHYSLTFLPIEIPLLVQKTEQQWKGNTFVDDAEGEYIDVELTKFPVGAVHIQNQTFLYWKQRENHPCHQIETQDIVDNEPLNATKIEITLTEVGIAVANL